MSLNAQLLRSSFALIVEREPALTHRFYDNLFADYPQTRPLFDEGRRDLQERMLAEALIAVLDHLEDAPWLQSTLRALGDRHRGYSVTPQMYSWVGASLIKTLAEVAGPDWNEATQAAWAEAYGAIVGLMQAGAKSARAS